MIQNTNSSFFTQMRRKFFNWRLNREIFHNIFPHVMRESNEGYPFVNRTDMNAHTEAFDLKNLLDGVERQIEALPEAYGECFRYAMHRDLYERLSMYADEAKRQTDPPHVEPRIVPTRA